MRYFNSIFDLIDSSMFHALESAVRVKSLDAIWIDFATVRKTYASLWFDFLPSETAFFRTKKFQVEENKHLKLHKKKK